jgi:hypothetical protein
MEISIGRRPVRDDGAAAQSAPRSTSISGCQRESPSAVHSALPLRPPCAAGLVTILVRTSSSRSGWPLRVATSGRPMPHAPSWPSGSRPGGLSLRRSRTSRVAGRPDGGRGPTVPESGRNQNAVPPNSGVSLPAKIGRVSGRGTRPGGGRDDRWPGPPATGHEPGGGAIIAGNQGDRPVRPHPDPLVADRTGGGPRRRDRRVMAAPAGARSSRCPSRQGILAIGPRTSGEGLLEDTIKT